MSHWKHGNGFKNGLNGTKHPFCLCCESPVPSSTAIFARDTIYETRFSSVVDVNKTEADQSCHGMGLSAVRATQYIDSKLSTKKI